MAHAIIRREARGFRKVPAKRPARAAVSPRRIHLRLPADSVKLAKELGVNIQAIARRHFLQSRNNPRMAGKKLNKVELDEMIYAVAGPKKVAARERKKELERKRNARLGAAVTVAKFAMGSPI